jgi:hypothetical protein
MVRPHLARIARLAKEAIRDFDGFVVLGWDQQLASTGRFEKSRRRRRTLRNLWDVWGSDLRERLHIGQVSQSRLQGCHGGGQLSRIGVARVLRP